MTSRTPDQSNMAESEDFDLLSVDVNKHPDLKELAASTTAAFEIIGPWCLKESELQCVSLITIFFI